MQQIFLPTFKPLRKCNKFFSSHWPWLPEPETKPHFHLQRLQIRSTHCWQLFQTSEYSWYTEPSYMIATIKVIQSSSQELNDSASWGLLSSSINCGQIYFSLSDRFPLFRRQIESWNCWRSFPTLTASSNLNHWEASVPQKIFQWPEMSAFSTLYFDNLPLFQLDSQGNPAVVFVWSHISGSKPNLMASFIMETHSVIVRLDTFSSLKNLSSCILIFFRELRSFHFRIQHIHPFNLAFWTLFWIILDRIDDCHLVKNFT